MCYRLFCFFFSSRRRHTRLVSDWSSDVCSSDLPESSRLSPIGGVTPKSARCAKVPATAPVCWHHGSRRPRRGWRYWRLPKIGRASCRERGEVSGGGGAIDGRGE